MKLALAFCVWQRTELEKIVIDYYKGLQSKYKFDIVVVGSEGKKSRTISEGCKYYEYPNTPISNKHNYLIEQCKDYDGVILIGSDDLIEPKLFDYYLSLPLKGYYGFPDVYYWQPKRERLSYWNGFFMGAGRFYSKDALTKMNYELWTEGLKSGLDTSARTRAELKGMKVQQPKALIELDAMIVDVKGFGSISSEGIVQAGINQNGSQSLSLLDRFPLCTIEKIKKLSSEL